MNCKSVQANLSAYVDREVGGDEMWKIRAHLADCDSCREEERDLRCLKSLLSEAHAPEPTVGFEKRLLESIHSQTQPHRKPMLQQFGHFALFTCVAAVTMLVMLQFLTVQGHTGLANSKAHDMTDEVRRDQVYEANISDPYNGSVITSVDYGR